MSELNDFIALAYETTNRTRDSIRYVLKDLKGIKEIINLSKADLIFVKLIYKGEDRNTNFLENNIEKLKSICDKLGKIENELEQVRKEI